MLRSIIINLLTIQAPRLSIRQSASKPAHAMKTFLSFRGSRAGFFSDLFTGESCPLRILRLRRSCGFPHTQVAKRTPPSRRSLQKGFHGSKSHENSQWMQIINAPPAISSRATAVQKFKRTLRSRSRAHHYSRIFVLLYFP
jgi:hypothetical protein